MIAAISFFSSCRVLVEAATIVFWLSFNAAGINVRTGSGNTVMLCDELEKEANGARCIGEGPAEATRDTGLKLTGDDSGESSTIRTG